MSTRLPQAPRDHDSRNQNETRRTIEQRLTALLRRLAELEAQG